MEAQSSLCLTSKTTPWLSSLSYARSRGPLAQPGRLPRCLIPEGADHSFLKVGAKNIIPEQVQYQEPQLTGPDPPSDATVF